MHRTGLQEDQYNLEIYIKDTVIIIPPENHKVILEGFMLKQPPSGISPRYRRIVIGHKKGKYRIARWKKKRLF